MAGHIITPDRRLTRIRHGRKWKPQSRRIEVPRDVVQHLLLCGVRRGMEATAESIDKVLREEDVRTDLPVPAVVDWHGAYDRLMLRLGEWREKVGQDAAQLPVIGQPAKAADTEGEEEGVPPATDEGQVG